MTRQAAGDAAGRRPDQGVSAPFIRLNHVSFRYGRRLVLRDLDIDIGPGITGLLGPNGAGKSTLMALAATLLKPRSGEVEICGRATVTRRERVAARQQIGFLPQHFDLVGSMTALETVTYCAWLNGVPDRQCQEAARTAISSVGVTGLERRRVRTLSGGQRQRVGIAASIAHNPPLLLLDEPTAGLDPTARITLRRTLSAIAAGRAVLVSTHLVEDMVHLSQRLVVMKDGRVVHDGAPSSLVDLARHTVDDTLSSPYERAYEFLLGQ